jgi:hypothetical protein
VHHFLSEVARRPENADEQTRRVAVAAPARAGTADWIADSLALGPALLSAAVDDQLALPAAFAGRLDVLVWCVDAAAPRAAELRQAVATLRPLRIVVLVVPATFVPGGLSDPAAAPPLGGVGPASLWPKPWRRWPAGCCAILPAASINDDREPRR